MSRRPRNGVRALVAVCAAVLLSAVPGIAAAAPPHVSPVLDCHGSNSDGTHTVVLGYENSHGKTWTHPYGSDNRLYPAKFQGSQPTEFRSGTHAGVFSLRMTAAELSAFRWELARDTLDLRTAGSVSQCPPSTPLPALGNGAGIAAVLVAGGLFGVWFVRRVIRRATASA